MIEFFVYTINDPESGIDKHIIQIVMPIGKSLRVIMNERIQNEECFLEEELYSIFD